ncbi:hypothetical protein FIBSPDRAFT_893765 [Athelia psychrophila]|uniref:Uncharacterized protein n=1 Tax=Athelia psychrophila TaxID=1759441 RepID=A0A166GPA7_9AGAM|nr:hypothetical protein FIBSPDRAFT_893765 [Fibularhizoctonia sp. CBS 109695]
MHELQKAESVQRHKAAVWSYTHERVMRMLRGSGKAETVDTMHGIVRIEASSARQVSSMDFPRQVRLYMPKSDARVNDVFKRKIDSDPEEYSKEKEVWGLRKE